MRRSIFLVLVAVVLIFPACISALDTVWFNPKPLDEYVFPNNSADETLIEVVTLQGTSVDGEDAPTLYGVWLQVCDDEECVANNPRAQLPILYLHGNADHIDTYWDRIQILHRLGHPVFAIDYRGFGRSTGMPTEAGLYADGQTAYRHMRERLGEESELLVYGFSLGSAPAVEVAISQNISALILEAPFASAQAFGDQGGVGIDNSTLMNVEFDNLGKIPQVDVPLLIAHGERDDFVSFQFGQLLFDTANEPKDFFVEPEGEHSTVPCPDRDGSVSPDDDPCFATDEYQAAWNQFIEETL